MQLRGVNLTDPDIFEQGTPHEMFRMLRREAPVYWHEEPDGGTGFWAVTKYHDLKYVSKNPGLFSSARQGTMRQDPSPQDLPAVQSIMLNMDPPRHRQYRTLVEPGVHAAHDQQPARARARHGRRDHRRRRREGRVRLRRRGRGPAAAARHLRDDGRAGGRPPPHLRPRQQDGGHRRSRVAGRRQAHRSGRCHGGIRRDVRLCQQSVEDRP